MSTITLHLDNELSALLHRSNQPADRTALEMIVLELYRRGTISSGNAARRLDMSRWEFVQHASRLGIPFFDMTEDEWQAERAQAEAL